MALYLGSNKCKIKLNSVLYNLKLFSTTLITNNAKLLSSEGYILKDADGKYLTVKGGE